MLVLRVVEGAPGHFECSEFGWLALEGREGVIRSQTRCELPKYLVFYGLRLDFLPGAVLETPAQGCLIVSEAIVTGFEDCAEADFLVWLGALRLRSTAKAYTCIRLLGV